MFKAILIKKNSEVYATEISEIDEKHLPEHDVEVKIAGGFEKPSGFEVCSVIPCPLS